MNNNTRGMFSTVSSIQPVTAFDVTLKVVEVVKQVENLLQMRESSLLGVCIWIPWK